MEAYKFRLKVEVSVLKEDKLLFQQSKGYCFIFLVYSCTEAFTLPLKAGKGWQQSPPKLPWERPSVPLIHTLFLGRYSDMLEQKPPENYHSNSISHMAYHRARDHHIQSHKIHTWC